MRSDTPKPFKDLTKIEIIIDKIDIYQTTNDFTVRKDSRKEQFGLLEVSQIETVIDGE